MFSAPPVVGHLIKSINAEKTHRNSRIARAGNHTTHGEACTKTTRSLCDMLNTTVAPEVLHCGLLALGHHQNKC